MILTGQEIRARLNNDIVIEPFNERQLGPNSYNLRLHEKLLIYDANVLDMKKPNAHSPLIIPPEGLTLQPGKLYLGRTVEYTKTYNLVPMLEGRSSVGRLGLFIHITAGFGDIGFAGYWTLEIFCVQPIVIYPNIEICQIYYHTVQGGITHYKSTKYQNNTDVQASKFYMDFE